MENEVTKPENEIANIPHDTQHQISKISNRMHEIQSAITVAKKFPRDMVLVEKRILDSCKRFGLADKSLYKYPRGGKIVTGESIRLAESLAQAYGNCDYGVIETERYPDYSICESYCWDLETNVRASKKFQVGHYRDVSVGEGKDKVKEKRRLLDERDIYEVVANNGARRVRACILNVIPIDIRELAVERCKQTMRDGDGQPLTTRIAKILMLFEAIGIAQANIEERLGHPAAAITLDEIVDLGIIYNTIKDKHAHRGDFFKGFDKRLGSSKVVDTIRERLNDGGVNNGSEGAIKETTGADKGSSGLKE